MIRKLKSGEYRIYPIKTDPKTGRRCNLGTFATREAAENHERAVFWRMFLNNTVCPPSLIIQAENKGQVPPFAAKGKPDSKEKQRSR